MLTEFAKRQVSQFLVAYCLLFSTKIRSFISVLCPKQLVITKGYGEPGDNK